MADFDPKEFEGMFKIFLDKFMKSYDRRYSGSSKTFQDFIDSIKDGTADLDKNSTAHIRMMDALKNLDKEFEKAGSSQRSYGKTHEKVNDILHSHLGMYGKLGSTIIDLSRALGGLRGSVLAFGAGLVALSVEQFAYVSKTLKNVSQNGTYTVFARAETPGKNVADVIGSSAEQLGISISSLIDITQEYGSAIDYYGIESFKRLAKSQSLVLANYGLSTQETDKLLASMIESQRIAGVTNKLDESYRMKLAADQAVNIQEIARATKQSAEAVQKKMEEAARSPGFQTALAGSKLSEDQKAQVLENYQSLMATVPETLRPIFDNMVQNRLTGLPFAMDEQYKALLPDQSLTKNLDKIAEAAASGNVGNNQFKDILNSTLASTAGQMNKNTDVILAKAMNNPALINAYSGLQEFSTRFRSEQEKPLAEKESDKRLFAAQAALASAIQGFKGTFEGAFFKGLGDTGTAKNLADSITKFAESIGNMLVKNQPLIERILKGLPVFLEKFIKVIDWLVGDQGSKIDPEKTKGTIGTFFDLITSRLALTLGAVAYAATHPIKFVQNMGNIIGKVWTWSKSLESGLVSKLPAIGKYFSFFTNIGEWLAKFGPLGKLAGFALKKVPVLNVFFAILDGILTFFNEFKTKGWVTAFIDGVKNFLVTLISLPLMAIDYLTGTNINEYLHKSTSDMADDLVNFFDSFGQAWTHFWKHLKDYMLIKLNPLNAFKSDQEVNEMILKKNAEGFNEKYKAGNSQEKLSTSKELYQEVDDYIQKFGIAQAKDQFKDTNLKGIVDQAEKYGNAMTAFKQLGVGTSTLVGKNAEDPLKTLTSFNRSTPIEQPQKVTIVSPPAEKAVETSKDQVSPTTKLDSVITDSLQNPNIPTDLKSIFQDMQMTLEGILTAIGKTRIDSILRDQ